MNCNDIISVIAYNISILFPLANIYKEDVIQNLKPPAFLVRVLSSNQQKLIGNRYERVSHIVIKYFASFNKDNAIYDINLVKERLYELETLKYKDKQIRCLSLEDRTEDGILNFFLDVRQTIARSQPSYNKFKENELEVNQCQK